MIGQTLGDKYSLVRLLGEGGMGSVYEARHTGTGRRVAVKVITGELGRDSQLVSRFEREARAAGAIESEHIAQVLDVGRDEASGAPFLAMDLLVGEDLAQVFARLGPVPADVALRIGVQACLGLEKAHAAGIVHRDIKPANLFLTQRDNGELVVKILDFGIAKVIADELGPEQKKRPLTRTGAIVGSPLYMSPEQSRYRGRLDHRTDLWSLGVVLYQALAGRTPLEHAESIGDFIVAVCTTRSAPIHAFAPWVDPGVASAVERALAIDPEGRYQTAAEMREALSVFLPGGAHLRASMLMRAPEAGPAPPPSSASPHAEATPSNTPVPATVPGQPVSAAFAIPTPLPTRTVPTPPPGATSWAPSAHGPLVPLSAVVGAAPARMPPPPAPKRGNTALFAGLLAIAALGGLAGVYALGWMGEHGTTVVPTHDAAPAAPETSIRAAPPIDLRPLAGSWWGEGGVAYEGVVVGETVELRIRDPELLAGQGYTLGEPIFVLRPMAPELHELQVEARIRPPPPKGFVYDRARATASCVASWTHVAGKPLQAVLAIDRLVVQTVKIDPPPSAFAHEGIRVVSCTGLGEAHAASAETVLGRTATQAPPKWVPPHDAGVHDAGGVGAGGGHDAGAGHDAGVARDAGPTLPHGKGSGAPCTTNAQCASHHCVAMVCK